LDLCFFDLEKIEDGKLKIFLLALKYSRNPDLWRVLPWIIRRSEELQKDQKWQYDYLKVVLLYLMSVIKKKQIHRFKEIVSKEHSEGMGYMETIADAFREEERLKREKAERIVAELRKEIKQKNSELEKKDEQLVRRMLENGLDFQLIRKITGLSIEKIEQIQKTDN
jgi:predicted transposase YdaD